MILLIVSYDFLCAFMLKSVYHSNGSDAQIPTVALFLHLQRLNLSFKSLQNPEKEHYANSPVCLQTKPPAEWSGYVHLVSLRTGHLCAFVPEVTGEQKNKKKTKQNLTQRIIYLYIIYTLHNFTQSRYKILILELESKPAPGHSCDTSSGHLTAPVRRLVLPAGPLPLPVLHTAPLKSRCWPLTCFHTGLSAL